MPGPRRGVGGDPTRRITRGRRRHLRQARANAKASYAAKPHHSHATAGTWNASTAYSAAEMASTVNTARIGAPRGWRVCRLQGALLPARIWDESPH
jgi:hypothetical protein